MTAIATGDALASAILGNRVVRAAALQPQTAQGAIFTVTGGRVLITSLVGQVAVATPATTNTLKVTGNPTSGTDVDWCTATSTASKEVGSVITLPAAFGSALVVNNAGGGPLVHGGAGVVANIGTVDLVASGSAATGTIRWTLTYVPLDTGATVTAA